jgi:hypothetical protein
MSVSLEKIDMLMERANISYKEAKETLERFDGDLVEALIYLESDEKVNYSKKSNSSFKDNFKSQKNQQHSEYAEKAKKGMRKLTKMSFVIEKKDKTLLNIPLLAAIILLIATFPVFAVLVLIPYLFGYEIQIYQADGKKFKHRQHTESNDIDVL